MDATDPRAQGRLDEPAANVLRGEQAPWWDGRQVAIRPDVPGSTFDPRNTLLVRNDKERLEAQVRIASFVEEIKRRTVEQLWPEWLWHADDLADSSLEDNS